MSAFRAADPSSAAQSEYGKTQISPNGRQSAATAPSTPRRRATAAAAQAAL